MPGHNTKDRANQLLTVALDIITPDVQSELDALSTQDAQTELRNLQRQLRDRTGCGYKPSRDYISHALRIRRGENVQIDTRGGYREENTGERQWKARERAMRSTPENDQS